MPTQNVNLTVELESFVKGQVESGFYNNASEVHRAALAAMARAEEERRIRLERLRAELQTGIDDLKAGRYRTVSSEEEHAAFFTDLRRKVVKSGDA